MKKIAIGFLADRSDFDTDFDTDFDHHDSSV